VRGKSPRRPGARNSQWGCKLFFGSLGVVPSGSFGVFSDTMEHDDSAALDRCIAEKDSVLRALVADEGRLQPFRQAVVSAARNVPEVAAWRQRHETLTALMREAAQMQKSNESLLARRMEHVRGKLRTMSQGRETLSAYGASCQGRALSTARGSRFWRLKPPAWVRGSFAFMCAGRPIY